MPSYNFVFRNVDWTGGTFKVALLNNDYVPSRSHDFFSDVDDYEISGSGYTAGGVAVTNPTVVRASDGFLDYFTTDTAAWTGLSGTDLRYAVLYEDTGVAATSPLIDLQDLSVHDPDGSWPRSPVNANCSVAPGGNGWTRLRYEF